VDAKRPHRHREQAENETPDLPISSSASVARAVIGQRLKLSGMHWPVPGATGIRTLRCQQASGRWEQIWQQTAQPDATR
jgi:hypothetical protein